MTVFAPHAPGEPAAFEVRSFTPADGIPEDPVCGSGNGCVAALVQRHRLIDGGRYIATQGCALGRDGRVEVELAADGEIWIGGSAVICVEGTLAI